MPENSIEKVWVVDDDKSIRWVLEKALTRANIAHRSFENAKQVLQTLQKSVPQVLITDIRMPGASGLELLERVKAEHPQMPVIVMTAYSDLDSAVSAFQGGAFEYLAKPFDIDAALALISRALAEVDARQPKPASSPNEIAGGSSELLGQAQAMQELFRAIGRLSQSSVSVLINGESGTGKELVARALHRHSARSKRAFVAINTAAIPKDLLESELFGHERGSFTGAQQQRKGRFEQAEGGTLFLDEIGDMPLDLQVRLLRVLQDGEYYRVGGHAPLRADVRIVAATHQNLQDRVSQGLFREDLFHRLNVVRLHCPALRERPEDIPLLAKHFLSKVGKELGGEIKDLAPEALVVLKNYAFPGNVRQLENMCHWLTVMTAGQTITAQGLPPEVLQQKHNAEAFSATLPANAWLGALDRSFQAAVERREEEPGIGLTADFERQLIRSALTATQGRRMEAAKLLGWGRNTITRKISELDLELELKEQGL